jgi:hypothetical protein
MSILQMSSIPQHTKRQHSPSLYQHPPNLAGKLLNQWEQKHSGFLRNEELLKSYTVYYKRDNERSKTETA